MKKIITKSMLCVCGINPEDKTVRIMDPDIYCEQNHIFDISINHLFDSLWRRQDTPGKFEKIIVIGNY